jgi:hypothetical protein
MPRPAASWDDLFASWPLVQADLHEVYGIDTADEPLMTSRSWFWLATRIRGLLNHPSRVTRVAAALSLSRDEGGFDGSRPR